MKPLTLRGRDEGFTVVEMVIAVAITSLTLASVATVASGLLKDVARESAMAQVQRDARPVLDSLVIELRQSSAPTSAPSSRPIQEIAWNRLVFYSDRLAPHPAPEKYVYELVNCTNGVSGGTCDLQETVYTADTSSVAPDYTFNDAVVHHTSTLIENVVADPYLSVGPAFRAVHWVGSPATRTEIASCDSSAEATRCDAPLIVVDLHIAYSANIGLNPLVLHEEVRLRNAVD
ncbi:MAG: hypothetical protein GWP04_08875 [Gammaproteobacteria bacterium]|nr:hypothetical protein [Gammaproteobacteria bacterium]